MKNLHIIKQFLKHFLLFFLLINISVISASTINVSVNNNIDDAEEDVRNGSINRSSSDLEMVIDKVDGKNHDQIIGVRFRNINIPSGSRISNAYITFQADKKESRATSLTIYAHNFGNSLRYTDTDYDISSRAKTAGIAWNNIPTWYNHLNYNTPNLSTIVQTVINRCDWNSGNAISFIIEGSGKRRAESHDGSHRAPKLFIEYDSTTTLTANDDSATTQSIPVTIPVLDNDLSGTGETFTLVNITSIPSDGTVTVNHDNTVVYTPDVGFVGTDTFSYRVNNSAPDTSNEATVTINVTEAPLTCVSYDNNLNDTCNGNSILFLDGKTPNVRGCITGSSADSDSAHKDDYYKFTVGNDYGILNITTSSPNHEPYHLAIGNSCDGEQYHLYNTTAEEHTIDPIPLSPGDSVYIYVKETGGEEDQYRLDFNFTTASFIANDDKDVVTPNSHKIIDILENDSPGNGNSIDVSSVTITQVPTHGSVGIFADGTVQYTPTTNYKGNDTFKYTVDNNTGATSNEATVSITVGIVAGSREFTIRNPVETRNIQGNYFIGGNTNICITNLRYNDSIVNTMNPLNWTCSANVHANNNYYTKYNDVDFNPFTFNSSSFDLNISEGSEVVWAGLYWQGFLHNSGTIGKIGPMEWKNDFRFLQSITKQPTVDNRENKDDSACGGTGSRCRPGLDLSVNSYDAEKVKFKTPTSGAYIDVVAEQVDYDHLGYSGFKDVTNLLDLNNPNGTYTVANIQSHQGHEHSHGNFAGWSLVVIYKNVNEDYRNISVFDGYATVTSSFQQDIEISGFLTPDTTHPINSKVSFFSMEGEPGGSSTNIGDRLRLVTDIYDGNLSNAENPWYDVFNSTITKVDTRNPSLAYNVGLDIDTFELTGKIGPMQSSAILRPRSTGDRYTPSVFIFSADIYTPKFCYDYSYQQNEEYFTEDNTNNSIPYIVGKVDTTHPVEVKLYLRNKENSNVMAQNMRMKITDINTTQAEYYTGESATGSVYLTAPNSITKDLVPDSSLTIDNEFGEYIKDISIGDVGSYEYFYLYYSLMPKMTDLNMSIEATVNYDLHIELAGTVFDVAYATQLSNKIEMCTENNFEYRPVTGIFNVVHNDYYNKDLGGANQYYNLPTQVTSREGNFKVLALDINNNDTLKPLSTIVAVEMIDVAAFHDTEASCKEPSSSISEKIWVLFENNTTSTMFDKNAITNYIGLNNTISSSAEFYKNARANTAFRVSYNVSLDGNGSLVEIKKQGDDYKIVNYTQTIPSGSCASSVIYPIDSSTNATTTSITDACGSDGDLLSTKHLQSCMECIYGLHTKMICSRDNFAIRPEALSIKLNDQNQTNTSVKLRLDDNISGITTTLSTNVLDLASGYNYNIEVNATNHLNNDSSSGYIKTLSVTNGDVTNYIWEPHSGSITTGCNDITDKNISISFINGKVNTITSNDQIGEYRLSLIDKTWTKVDNNPVFMTHHTGAYFLNSATKDCIANSSITNPVSATTGNKIPLIGCYISSNHNSSGYTYKYRDYNVKFHPYKFDLSSVIPSTGLNHTPLNTNSFVYMTDIDAFSAKDENMSFHLNGSIKATGYNNVINTNYVDNCFVKPISLSVIKTPISGATAYRYRLYTLNSDSSVSNSANDDLNNSSDSINVSSSEFKKDLNGSIDTILNLNFKRTVNKALNPEILTYTAYEVNTTTTFNADLIDSKTAHGDLNISSAVKYYYGRTHSSRQRYKDDNGTANIYFEVFCHKNIDGNDCNKSLLQNGITSKRTNDMRWFINEEHNSSVDGVVGKIIHHIGTGSISDIVKATTPTTTNPAQSTITYDGSYGHPYKTTMENNASSWLIHNEFDSTADRNEFSVEFEAEAIGWSGKHETNVTVKDEKVPVRTNRRSMW